MYGHGHRAYFVVDQNPQCGLNSWSRSLILPCSCTRVGLTSQQPFQDTWYPSLSDISLTQTIRYVSLKSSCKYGSSFFHFCAFYLGSTNTKRRKQLSRGPENLLIVVSSRCGRPAKQRCLSFWNRGSSLKLIWRPKFVQFCLNWPNPAVMMTTKLRPWQ